jgi:calcineurin-like phosphoesterase family protein
MKTFLIGCLHLGHEGIYKFKGPDGSPLRPYADNAEDGDRYIINRYNDMVSKEDRVYFMGDVSISRKSLLKISEMNGRKVLIKGNHDIFKLKDYLPYFDDIRAEHKLGKFKLSHTPLHPGSLPPWCEGNIHAHIHAHRVMIKGEDGEAKEDPRYFNTCLEATSFLPISFNAIQSAFADRRKRGLFDGLDRSLDLP